MASPEEIAAILRTAVTDPARVRRDDPGNPNVCNVYALHDHFTPQAEREDIEIRCQTATIGCVDCKRRLASNMADDLAPIRARAEELRAKPDRVYEILEAGAERAQVTARETLHEALDRMGLERRSIPSPV